MSDNLRITNPAALGALARGDVENFLAAATPGGIEAQEARGQSDLVASFDRLPKDGDQAAAEALGFIFGADVDDIFVSVTAPPGWRLRPTDHSMHSDILDGQGRVRGIVFYKAAFYDRRADYSLGRRFKLGATYSNAGEPRTTVFDARDSSSGEMLWQSAPIGQGEWAAQDEARAAAEAFLDERWPNWRDATAYWDA